MYHHQVSQLSSRLKAVTSALEKLWCLTQDVMSNGGFCITDEKIFTGGNYYFDLEVRGYMMWGHDNRVESVPSCGASLWCARLGARGGHCTEALVHISIQYL